MTRLPAGSWTAVWLLVAVAMYGCVPETDHLELIGAVLGGLLLGELANRRSWNWGVHLALASVLIWAVRHGAVGQERALVGGSFAFWPIIVLGALLLVSARASVVGVSVLIAGAAALAVSRTGALEPGWSTALRSVAVWGGASAAVIALVVAVGARPTGRRRQPFVGR